jgi:hypothetical protein
MHHNWNFLYSFWNITASSAHLALPYDPKHPNASNRITTPRLHSPLFASHHIASGHTSHRIWPHPASYLVTPRIVSHRPGRFTSSTHSHSIQSNQYHHSKTKTKLGSSNRHRCPGRTLWAFSYRARFSVVNTGAETRRLDRRDASHRSPFVYEQEAGSWSAVHPPDLVEYRPMPEPGYRVLMIGRAPPALGSDLIANLGVDGARPTCPVLLRRDQARKRLRLLGRNTSCCFLLREYGPASFSVIRSCFEAYSRHRTRHLRPRRPSSTTQLGLRPPTRVPGRL